MSHFAATIVPIKHEHQRYNTCGDWREGYKSLHIDVSQLPDWRYEALIAIHELVEAVLCRHAGISQEAVDAFDIAHPEAPEPGDLNDAPYRHQHAIASGIERLLAAELGVDWLEYDKAIEALDASPAHYPWPGEPVVA